MSGRAIAHPLSTIQAYLDWRRFEIPPFEGGTRSWPASWLEEWRLIHSYLNEPAPTDPDDDGSVVVD